MLLRGVNHNFSLNVLKVGATIYSHLMLNPSQWNHERLGCRFVSNSNKEHG
jgi:hypothetical protein